MYKIAIFQSDMRVGGIQRSLANLLNYIADREDILVHVFIADGEGAFYALPECDNIKYFYLQTLPYINRLLPFNLVKAMWAGRIKRQIDDALAKCREKNEYDVSIDFNSYWNECAIGALLVNAKKKICYVHNDVKIKMKEEPKYKILHTFFKKKYASFNHMAMVSEGVVESFYEVNKNAPKRYTVINNIIDTDEICDKLSSDVLEAAGKDAINDMKAYPDRIEIVSVGRLSHQKGYDILIQYAEKICQNKSSDEIHFTIIGDGPLKHDIIKWLEEKKLTEYFTLTGNLKNPFPVMAEGDAFLMCSRYEGQGIVFWEARALGLPVIIPRSLEKYTGGIAGVDDIEAAVLGVVKRKTDGEKRYLADELNEYKSNWEKAFWQIGEV